MVAFVVNVVNQFELIVITSFSCDFYSVSNTGECRKFRPLDIPLEINKRPYELRHSKVDSGSGGSS